MVHDNTQQCATLVMDTIPMVMRTIGGEMHRRHAGELPMQQFRALMFLRDHEGASLSLLARHRGSSISSASKLVDGLVERGYVSREVAPEDRRRIVLALTQSGEATLELVHREGVGYLAGILTMLSANERATVMRAMELLRSVFASTRVRKAGRTTPQGEQSCQ